MKIKYKFPAFLLAVALSITGCNYLEIVPDNMPEMDDQYTNREKATGALAGCYSYLPYFNNVRYSMSFATDEYCTILTEGWGDNFQAERLMRNLNSASSPIMNFWYGSHGAAGVPSLYQGIRYCNDFMDNIGLVPDMTAADKADYTAQAKVLKAYMHYYLIRLYGPIVIADKPVNVSSPPEDMYLERQPVDACFKYVVDLLDEAIPVLPASRTSTLAGQVDRLIAMTIKADVLLTAASPLFNGNAEYFNNFKNQRGELFFNITNDPAKWEAALTAIEEAIAFAEDEVGKSLYTYTQTVPAFDRDDWDRSGVMQYAYNKRYAINDPWNNELIWGSTNVLRRGGGSEIEYQPEIASQVSRMMDYSKDYRLAAAGNWLSTTYQMLQLFHTRNGVPISDDLTYDSDNMLEIVTIPEDDYHLGYMQQSGGEKTIRLHLNREPRFYAWVAPDRCIWRNYDERVNIKMMYGEEAGGAFNTNNRYFTGIAIKKFIHPKSLNGDVSRIVNYPFPIYRLSDLYLMAAEALNEANGPSQEVYDYLNAVRRIGGVPDIEVVWSDAAIVRDVGKHTTQTGLREIIQQERLIELCYEGHRYFDILRWKRAKEFFNAPIQGFNVDATTAEDFYVLKTLQQRSFQSPRNYLMPVGRAEMLNNPNLVQTVGW